MLPSFNSNIFTVAYGVEAAVCHELKGLLTGCKAADMQPKQFCAKLEDLHTAIASPTWRRARAS